MCRSAENGAALHVFALSFAEGVLPAFINRFHKFSSKPKRERQESKRKADDRFVGEPALWGLRQPRSKRQRTQVVSYHFQIAESEVVLITDAIPVDILSRCPT